MLGEDLAIGGAGELAPAIGVDDEWAGRTPLPQRHAQGGDDQRGIEDRIMAQPTTRRLQRSRTATR